MTTTPHHRAIEETREQLAARSQPVRLVSIDDVTVSQLVMLELKLLVAAIPVLFVVGFVWFAIAIIGSRMFK
jgi:hypothetical protein